MRHLALLLVLSACSTTLPSTLFQGDVAPNPSPGFVPDAAGLADIGTGLRIDFDRSRAGVIPLLDNTLGRHKTLPLRGCPVGVTQNLQWGDLTLTFTRERFVGWQQQGNKAGQTCTG